MSNPKHPPIWHPSDELRFADLAARREAFHSHYGAALRKAILSMWPAMKAPALEHVVEDFQNNADRLRDALAPYDSGVRPALNNASLEGEQS